jgi:hypothetical protein
MEVTAWVHVMNASSDPSFREADAKKRGFFGRHGCERSLSTSTQFLCLAR